MRQSQNTTKAPRIDVYEQVTSRILQQMESAQHWQKPWSVGGHSGKLARPVNLAGKPYRGINVALLWSAGYASPTWGTFKAWQERGCMVRRGEKATHIVFWKALSKTETNEVTGEDEEREFLMARGYCVFNAEQVDGYAMPIVEPVSEGERNATAEQFFSATGLRIRFGGSRAYYMPSVDAIQMPVFGSFKGSDTSSAAESFYSTLAHECVHGTGHKSRLDRDFSQSKRWGDEAYAAEELVAEMGAAYICADLGISIEPRQDHANYLASWIKVLRGDKRAIFTAASKAEKACQWLHDAAGSSSAEDDDNAVVESVSEPVAAPLPEPVPTPQPVPAPSRKPFKWSKVRQAERREVNRFPQRTRYEYEVTARAYARWLAERDGIALASHNGLSNSIRWDGKFVRSVLFERATGGSVWVDIPHHDWQPSVTACTFDDRGYEQPIEGYEMPDQTKWPWAA